MRAMADAVGVPFDPKQTTIDLLPTTQRKFEECVNHGELKHYHRGNIPTAAYGFRSDESKAPYFAALTSGVRVFISYVRVFISYTRSFEARVKRIYELLKTIGVSPWWDKEDAHHGTIPDKIFNGIHDSCLVVFLITSDFTDQGYIADEIDQALHRLRNPLLRNPSRFELLPIIVLEDTDRDTDFPDLRSARGPARILDRGIIYQPARTDADIIGHIVEAMPVRIGVTKWKTPSLRV